MHGICKLNLVEKGSERKVIFYPPAIKCIKSLHWEYRNGLIAEWTVAMQIMILHQEFQLVCVKFMGAERLIAAKATKAKNVNIIIKGRIFNLFINLLVI